jgi:hypothetical protein
MFLTFNFTMQADRSEVSQFAICLVEILCCEVACSAVTYEQKQSMT